MNPAFHEIPLFTRAAHGMTRSYYNRNPAGISSVKEGNPGKFLLSSCPCFIHR